jgi:ankyrin repeat protein
VGASPDAALGEACVTRFMTACWWGAPRSIDYLIERGANVYLVAPGGQEALDNAVKMNRPRLVTRPLEMGVDPDYAGGRSGLSDMTHLMRAASRNNTDCIAPLLTAGADPTLQDSNERTALDYARDDTTRIRLAAAVSRHTIRAIVRDVRTGGRDAGTGTRTA